MANVVTDTQVPARRCRRKVLLEKIDDVSSPLPLAATTIRSPEREFHPEACVQLAPVSPANWNPYESCFVFADVPDGEHHYWFESTADLVVKNAPKAGCILNLVVED